MRQADLVLRCELAACSLKMAVCAVAEWKKQALMLS